MTVRRCRGHCYYALLAVTPSRRKAFELSRLLVGVVVPTLAPGYTLSRFPLGGAVDGLGEKLVLVVR